jgi:S-adenosylmethionine/arginine decarboxylase-like enzyme
MVKRGVNNKATVKSEAYTGEQQGCSRVVLLFESHLVGK